MEMLAKRGKIGDERCGRSVTLKKEGKCFISSRRRYRRRGNCEKARLSSDTKYATGVREGN
jgi:hypothetical protein